MTGRKIIKRMTHDGYAKVVLYMGKHRDELHDKSVEDVTEIVSQAVNEPYLNASHVQNINTKHSLGILFSDKQPNAITIHANDLAAICRVILDIVESGQIATDNASIKRVTMLAAKVQKEI